MSWHYTIRSADGHVAQHVATRNVAAHAGNWYLNMHSIGFEHEGFAAQPGAWYTEALYRNSAELAKYLAAKYGFELDRAHVVGHDQFGSVQLQVGPGPVLGLGALHGAARRADQARRAGAAARSSPSSPASPTTRTP